MIQPYLPYPCIYQKKEESGIASSLNLNLEEYRRLSHTGIRAVTDSDGAIISYYTIISPLNPNSILDKIEMNKSRTVYFALVILQSTLSTQSSRQIASSRKDN